MDSNEIQDKIRSVKKKDRKTDRTGTHGRSKSGHRQT